MGLKILIAFTLPFAQLCLGMLRIAAALALLAFAALLDTAMLFPHRRAGRAAREVLLRLVSFTRR